MKSMQRLFHVLMVVHMAVPVRKVTTLTAIPAKIAVTQKLLPAVTPILTLTTAVLRIMVLPIHIRVLVPSVSMSATQARSPTALPVIRRW